MVHRGSQFGLEGGLLLVHAGVDRPAGDEGGLGDVGLAIGGIAGVEVEALVEVEVAGGLVLADVVWLENRCIGWEVLLGLK